MINENNKIKLITIIGLILSILFFFIAVHMGITSGYERDAGYYISDFFNHGVWILLFASIISTIWFLIISRFKSNSITTVVSGIICIVLFIYGLIITVGWFYSYNEVKKDLGSTNAITITLEQLE